MRHLVTGGTGFLGSALCRRLAAEGHEVISFDNGSRNQQPPGPGVTLAYCDVRSRGSIDMAWEEAFGARAYEREPDVVWHLAAVNGTATFYSDPARVLNVQIRGTQNILDKCHDRGVRNIVLFSSSEAYQTPPVIPTPEQVPLTIPDITNPRYSYAIGKIAAEAMVWHGGPQRVVTIRPHQAYGPNAGYEHVIPQFILRTARTPDNGTFDILGASTRSFIYIDDFTDAMFTIWNHTQNQEGRVREIYHVGTEDMVSTVALAGQITDLMGRKGPYGGRAYKFKTKPGPEGGTRSRCPDTTKLRSLGWAPKVSLEDGLKRTIAAYRERETEWPA